MAYLDIGASLEYRVSEHHFDYRSAVNELMAFSRWYISSIESCLLCRWIRGGEGGIETKWAEPAAAGRLIASA